MITVLVAALVFFILMLIVAFMMGLAMCLPGWLLIIGFVFLDYGVFKLIKKRKEKK